MQNTNDDGDIQTNYERTVDSFDKLGLKVELLKGIYSYGYEKPSAIQQRAIEPAISGRDVLAQAQSGTGKTATFTISVLQLIDTTKIETQALILAPTRELAKQIEKVISNIGQELKVRVYACIGGTNTATDIEHLKSGQQVIVGTPGRVSDLLTKGYLKRDDIKVFVLDEADEMLSRGFVSQIQKVYSHLPQEAQIMLLSATIPDSVLEVVNDIMKDPVKILVKKENLTLQGINQFYVDVEMESYKYSTLIDLYKLISVTQCVIFVNTVKKANILHEHLEQNKFTSAAIHGEMTQAERDEVMKTFRNGKARVLIATDILARGIDVQQVSLVINYDIPNSKETYIHRIGRGGRFGRKGTAINFITKEDKPILDDFQSYYSTKIIELPANIEKLL